MKLQKTDKNMTKNFQRNRGGLCCDLCGADDSEVLCERDRDGKPLRTVICRECGLVYSDPRPSEEEVREYYEHEYRLDYKAAWQPSARRLYRAGRVALERVRALRELLAPGLRVLDFGAGGGEVVFMLRKAGCEAEGFEPNAGYARFAAEALGLPVRHCFWQEAEIAAGSFDLVTAFHVVEHLESPCAAMSRVREWLRPGGRFVVEVPNVEAVCHWPQHRFHRAHFYNFNLPALEMAGRRAGFEAVRSAVSRDGGNIMAVFERREERSAGPWVIPGNSERIRNVLRRHTPVRHFLSGRPLARLARKAAERLEELLAVRRGVPSQEVLGSLAARAGVANYSGCLSAAQAVISLAGAC